MHFKKKATKKWDVGFVEWAKQQMNVYADLFRKQVFVSDADPKVVEQALHINKHQSKKVCVCSSKP